jgi:glycosyltransferase involved in cell wall biosynthesis
MSIPAVTALIPTFNRAQFLPECLESVLAQTVPPTQVIVINDGSTDNTREVLQPFTDKIEYLEKENGGKSTALNLGLSKARGDYVWVMDDDDAAMPDALETHLKVLEEDPSVGFTYSARIFGRTRLQDGRLETMKIEPLLLVDEDEFYPRLLESFIFHQSSMLVRTSCYREVGPFDPQLLRSQDYEMILRLGRRFKARGIQKPTICFRQHAGVRGSASDRFEASQATSKLRRYDRIFMARFRKELDLEEYLPKRFRGKPLQPTDKRRAYLQRATVMARKAMFAEMLEDLQLALAQAGSTPPLTPSERAIIARGMTSLRSGETPLSDRHFMDAVRATCRGRIGREVMVEIGRGLYWRAQFALKSRRFGFFVEITRAACWLLRARGILLLLARKVREELPFSRQRSLASPKGEGY